MSVFNIKDYMPSPSAIRRWLDQRYGVTPGGTPHWRIELRGENKWMLVVYYRDRPGFDESFGVIAASKEEALQGIYVRARREVDARDASHWVADNHLVALEVQKNFNARFHELLTTARNRYKKHGQLLPLETIERRLAWQRLTCPAKLLNYWLRTYRGPNLEAPPFDTKELFELKLINKFGTLDATKFCAFVRKAIDTDYDPNGACLALKDTESSSYEALYPPLPKTVPGQITVPVRRKNPIAISYADLVPDRYRYPLASALSELYWLQRWGVSRKTLHLALGGHFDDVEGGYNLLNITHWRWAAKLRVMNTDFEALRATHFNCDIRRYEEFVRIVLAKLMRDKVLAWRGQPLTDFLYEDELNEHRAAMLRSLIFLTNALRHEDKTIEFPPRLLVRIMAGG